MSNYSELFNIFHLMFSLKIILQIFAMSSFILTEYLFASLHEKP